MSCFRGLLNEYKYLSIDRFDGANLLSCAYFLSHCHADHMMGLDNASFRNRITSRKNIFLYCSDVTRALLTADNRYSHLAEHICTIPVEHPTVIELETIDGEKKLICVTLLPAAHCPGSVMFLFEGNEGNVLYTGDFRLPKGSAKRMKNLHSSVGLKKHIKSMYVDTTFCTPNSVYIPSREDCLEGLIKVIGDWLQKGDRHTVRLNLSAKYGYEYLYHALHHEFAIKIYCQRKDVYRCLPDTYKILTDDSRSSRIFACFKKEKLHKQRNWKTANGDEQDIVKPRMLSITLSTMFFTHAALPHEVYRQVGKDNYRFCFSFHSSYSEVCDFVKYVNPETVYANVIPMNGSTLEDVGEKLALECGLWSQGYNTKDANLKPSPPFAGPTNPRPSLQAAIQEANTRKRASSFSSSDDDSQELFENLLKKSKKSENEITKALNDDANCNIRRSKDTTDEFDIASSPGSEQPMQKDIDALHVKIAQNYGPPQK